MCQTLTRVGVHLAVQVDTLHEARRNASLATAVQFQHLSAVLASNADMGSIQRLVTMYVRLARQAQFRPRNVILA